MHVDALYVPRTDNLAEKETNPLLKCKEATTTSHELYMCMYMRGRRNDKCKEKGKGMGELRSKEDSSCTKQGGRFSRVSYKSKNRTPSVLTAFLNK